ncbi:EAL domain-containing protein [Lysobacter yangpyeongensis]|uniref:EAL domain-containing protein n=1 Tax=Lysobacter yangpyeongensis TaxID=346182 RepID=A0ABW0SKI5_9GAMM
MATPAPELGQRGETGITRAGTAPTADFVSALFAVSSLDDIAAVAGQRLEAAFGARNTRLVWSPLADGAPSPQPLQWMPAHDIDAGAAASGWRRILVDLDLHEAGNRLLLASDWPASDCVPEFGAAAWSDFLGVLRARLLTVLELAEQRRVAQRLEKTAKLHTALFAIADLASSELDMPEMLARVHGVVGELMYAKNFFIALYDAARNSVRFIYFADEHDSLVVDPSEEIPAEEMRSSLTLAIIRHGRPALGPSRVLLEEFGLDYPDSDKYGPDSADWLGVPMVADGAVRGAIVVQSYDERARYTEEDRALLAFVAQHILTALIRKQAHGELERRVEERTRELTREVRERQRGEKLQAALYSIADLASSELDMSEMLHRIHEVVGELMYAKNFYIALYNAELDTLRFPYRADEMDPGLVRPDEEIPVEDLRSSLTLGLIRHGRTAMGPAREVAKLLDVPGGIGLGTPAADFLGVPMVGQGEVRGVVVVQSYDTSVHYTEEDRALLAYVAQHILTALMRKQAQGELERRVEDRTRELAAAVSELREQIEVRERAEQQLVHETLHDSLTGLPNRTFLYGAIERALARLQRDPDHRFAVLFLDLDRFKIINDSVGHLSGDQMLRQASERLAACVRDSDVVARLGGDEFALLMEDVQLPEDACHTAQRVIQALSEPMYIGGKELFTSASIGITLGSPRYHKAEELLRDADVAMYRAKAHGRHRFEIFDERLHQEALQLLDLEVDLRRAILRDEFEPHYQPIVDLRSGKVAGYEALLRWRRPGSALMLPGEFLKVAEDSGSVEQIDWRLFEHACREIETLVGDGGYVTINVSPRHFRSPALARQLLDLLDAYEVPPQRLRVELTEGALLENPDQVFATLDTLRRGGVLAALDDFGTGYSSLSYLHRFPLHALKIDRSFVSALVPGEGGSVAVVRAVLALANTLGMEVIAEGIETEAQRDCLLAIGCEQGQGFLFSRARPASDWRRSP